MIKVLFLVLVFIYANGTQIFDISDKEYEEYKKNPKEALKKLEDKYVLKKKIQKDMNKNIKISKKAQFKEKKILLTKLEVVNRLNYPVLMLEKNIDLLIKSISFHLKDTAISIDESEIVLVLNGIKKKKFTQFESNLYLNQLKNYMKE